MKIERLRFAIILMAGLLPVWCAPPVAAKISAMSGAYDGQAKAAKPEVSSTVQPAQRRSRKAKRRRR